MCDALRCACSLSSRPSENIEPAAGLTASPVALRATEDVKIGGGITTHEGDDDGVDTASRTTVSGSDSIGDWLEALEAAAA